ncbi:TonB-dependent receptor [Ursidibacter arcticus]
MSKLIHPYLLLPALSFSVIAGAETSTTEQLDEISVTAGSSTLAGSSVNEMSQISDRIISQEKLKKRSATLGNALSGELSVHSNPFGGGASSPIIRGQEGFRIKILQNGSDVVDMSAVSPDHAVAADSLLAQQIELIRGSSTLLYSTASPAGVVNVVDKRIPTALPENGFEGETNFRFDTASKERAATVGLTLAATKNIALRLEGLARKSDNYKVPGINLGHTIKFVPDTHNQSNVGTIGLSFIGDSGYLGVSYNKRDDKYGLPGHNHKFDNCSAHLIDPKGASSANRNIFRNYLMAYPHLADDSDVIDNPHFHCGSDHDQDHAHSHDNPFGYTHDHNHQGPWIELHSKRWDLRGEWRKPISLIDKIKVTAAYVDYYHDEKDTSEMFGSTQNAVIGLPIDGKAAAYFKSKGKNLRLETNHTPLGNLTGTWGVQYQTQKSSAHIPSERNQGDRFPLVPHKNKQISFFATEQYRWNNFLFEAGFRTEKQYLPIQYDLTRLSTFIDPQRYQYRIDTTPDLSSYTQRANSYSGSINWFFDDVHQFSFIYSHNERLPTPTELYYYGKHLATSSFMFGNKNLKKEKSDNFEIGFARYGDKLDYKLSLYQNQFDNYIHAENLWKSGNLFMRRYTQSKAKFQGIEGEMSFKPTPDYKITLFGDYISGKLSNVKPKGENPIYDYTLKYDSSKYVDNLTWEKELKSIEIIGNSKRNSPRVPPARLGLRFNGNFTESLSATIEYTYVFNQNKTSKSVIKTNKEKKEIGNDLFKYLDQYDKDGINLKAKLEADSMLSDDELESRLDNGPEILDEEIIKKIAEQIHNDQQKQDLYTSKTILEDATKGYHLLNVGLSYKQKWKDMDYTFNLSANNLLNQKIYVHNSFLPFVPQMGRNFIFGVEVKF